MTIDLKPCPFCGAQTLEIRKGWIEMTVLEMRMEDLENRLHALEERARVYVWTREERESMKEAEFADMYGEYVSKTTAAQIMGVTRATVYAMLTDGRIEGACGGKRVDVRSIARYISQRKGDQKHENPESLH